MDRNQIKILIFVGVLSVTSVIKAEFRTPLSIDRFCKGAIHSQFKKEADDKFTFDIWGAGYTKGAFESFKDELTTNTENLASIFFGKSSFRLEESHENAIVLPSLYTYPENPWTKIATITPKIDYSEKGFIFGTNLEVRGGPDNRAHFGIRASLPLRQIKIDNDGLDTGENFSDVYLKRTESGQDGFIARLDYLSASRVDDTDWLRYATIAGDGSITDNKVMTPVKDISGPTSSFTLPQKQDQPFYGVYGTSDGFSPSKDKAMFRIGYGTSVLNADGSLAAGTQARFLDNTTDTANGKNYYGAGGTTYGDALRTDRSAQRKLFLFPFQKSDSTLADQTNMFTSMDLLRATQQESVNDFFESKSISFDSQKRVGIGDFKTSFYVGYDFEDVVYAEANVGIKCPTAPKNTTPHLMYMPTLGNNGHVEIQLGTIWRLDLARCFNLDVNASYNFVLKATEKRAPSFKNATIKNICDEDMAIDASVRWDYFDGRVNFTFFHPGNENLGCSFGYEMYWKKTEKISFDSTTIKKALLDNSTVAAGTRTSDYNLDANVLALRSEQIAHKLHFEVFNYFDKFELFLGGAQTVAGKNAPRDSDCHIGMRVEF